jgi:hypothetical protein
VVALTDNAPLGPFLHALSSCQDFPVSLSMFACSAMLLTVSRWFSHTIWLTFAMSAHCWPSWSLFANDTFSSLRKTYHSRVLYVCKRGGPQPAPALRPVWPRMSGFMNEYSCGSMGMSPWSLKHLEMLFGFLIYRLMNDTILTTQSFTIRWEVNILNVMLWIDE